MPKKVFLEKKKKQLVREAKTEMLRLFAISRSSYPSPESLEYSTQAFAFSSRHKIPLTRELKESFCKKCHTPLFPGKNARVRISSGKCPKKIITCNSCGNKRRFLLKAKE